LTQISGSVNKKVTPSVQKQVKAIKKEKLYMVRHFVLLFIVLWVKFDGKDLLFVSKFMYHIF